MREGFFNDTLKVGPLDKSYGREFTVSKSKAKNIYGYDGTNKTWNVVIIASFSEKKPKSANYMLNFIINDIYTGDDISKGRDTTYDTTPFNFEHMEEAENVDEAIKDTVDVIFKIVDFAKALEHNPGGALGSLACDVFINTIGDLCQTFANFFQTGFVVGKSMSETIRPKLLPVFTYDYLLENQGYNQYTNVSTEEPEGGYDGTNRIKIKNEGFGFTQETKIPVAIVDFEALARNKVSNLDANFLIDDKNETHSVIWRTLRNAVAVIIRMILFLSAVFLLTLLIINSIVLATSVITPIEREARINNIQNFTKAVFMLIGTVVIMAIGIYSNLMVFNIADNAINKNEIDTNELAIRVYVEEAGYSFSTTTTGYMRYMASIDNVDKAMEKAKYSFTYLFLAISNLLFAILMFIRMIFIFCLACIGPLIVVQDIVQDIRPVTIIPINYRTWAIWFLSISLFQALMAVGCVIIKTAF